MQQVLFRIPIFTDRFPPDGIPVHGFGVMLFITFIACVLFLYWRSRRTVENMPLERVTDVVIAAFVGGLLGARITYLTQDTEVKTIGDFFSKFIRIWEGGIVLYGGIISGVLCFIVFHYFYLRKSGVSLWKLADAAAPGVAMGIALGRIGCFLNGCCYGHIAPEDCPSAGFPTLTCPAQEKVVGLYALQTLPGFTVKSERDWPQSVVSGVEVGSAAQRAGLQVGDKITGVNGEPNLVGLTVIGKPEALDKAAEIAREFGAEVIETRGRSSRIRIYTADKAALSKARVKIEATVLFSAHTIPTDVFAAKMSDAADSAARGRQTLTLDVERAGQTVNLDTFTPRTIGLHPTQLYETASMILLMFFLLAYYPYRRYDGQVFTLFLVCYAVHRFLNERLRNDTEIVGIPALNMSLSQNISVLMLLVALILEIGHRRWGKVLPRPTTATV